VSNLSPDPNARVHAWPSGVARPDAGNNFSSAILSPATHPTDRPPQVYAGRVPPGRSTVPARLPVTLTHRLASATGDELVLVMSDGTRETWTRARAG
jgi:hypothetical protein